MPLPTDIEDRQSSKTGLNTEEAPGAGFHAGLHNETNAKVNDLDAQVTGLGTQLSDEVARAEAVEAEKLSKAANLGDVADKAASRANIGLGSAATHDAGDFDIAGAAASALAAEKARAEKAEGERLAKAANLGDVADKTASRANLGLGGAAILEAGAAGEGGKLLKADDSHIPRKAVYAPAPSGDKTGKTDTGALAAAIPASGILFLQDNADYYVTKMPDWGPWQAINGGAGTTIHMVGTGVCLHVHNPEMSVAGGEVEFIGNQPGKGGSFAIDMSGSGPEAIGVQVGDIQNADLSTIIVRHGSGSNNIGWLFKSEKAWCESGTFRNITLINNTRNLVFADSGGFGSFDYNHYDFRINALANQKGVEWLDGVQLRGSELFLGGTGVTGKGNTGVMLEIGMDGSNVILDDVGVHIGFETSQGSGVEQAAHKTIMKGESAEAHLHGIISFKKGSSALNFADGNVTIPSVRFTCAGKVNIDGNLGRQQTGESLNVLGGSTYARGSHVVSGGNVEIGVNGGDYFTPTLVSGVNVLKIKNSSKNRPKAVTLVVTQPAAGATARLDLSSPGNNADGEAQTIIGIGTLTPINGAVDVIRLITIDGKTWRATVITKSNDETLGIMRPVTAPHLIPTTESVIGTINKALFVRAVAPVSGVLHDLSVFNGSVVNGNHNIAIFDTGQAAAGFYTPIWQSGGVAAVGENAPQIVGDPALAVRAGEQFLLAIMNSGNTHKYGITANAIKNNWMKLPTGFMPTSGGAFPKAVGFHTYTEFVFAAIKESELELTATPVVILGRIS